MLAFLFLMWYSIKAFDGSLAQLGEHLPYKQRVTGSIPVASTIKQGPRRFSPRIFYRNKESGVKVYML